jgi:single-stranded DNA-binding protein
MSKVGISLNINLSKIDKSKIVTGAKGKYIDLTAFVDLDEKDQFGNSGMITQNVSEDERKAGTKGPILGNSKLFWKGEGQQQNQSTPHQSAQQQAPQVPASNPPIDNFDDDIPF